jgi:hypothetical protein
MKMTEAEFYSVMDMIEEHGVSEILEVVCRFSECCSGFESKTEAVLARYLRDVKAMVEKLEENIYKEIESSEQTVSTAS